MLTRTQLDALSHLHMTGAQYPTGRHAPSTARYARRTLDALVVHGVARWSQDRPHGGLTHVVPVLHTWADAAGIWHVAVPHSITRAGNSIARAAIAGEVWSRDAQAYVRNWRPRVSITRIRDGVVEFGEG